MPGIAPYVGAANLLWGNPVGSPLPSGNTAITFPATPLRVRVSIALGANPSADPSTWSWTDITHYVRWNPGITVRTGRQDWFSTVTTGQATLTLDNRDGRFTRRNPNGAYYGLLTKNTPIWIEVDPGDRRHTVAEMFVNEWPARWDKSGKDSTVPITCAGVMRRLQVGTRAFSAMRRTIAATNPIVYWPLEDDSGSTQASSAVANGVPLAVVTGSASFGFGPANAGSNVTADLSGCEMSAPITGVSASGWYVEFGFYGLATPGQYTTANIYTNSNNYNKVIFGLPYDVTLGGQVLVTDSTFGPATLTWPGGFQPALTAAYATQWHHLALTAVQSGGNIIFTLYIDGTVPPGTGTATVTGTLGSPSRVTLNPGWQATSSAAAQKSFCHLAFGNGSGFAGNKAINGYVGELAHVRMARVCAEDGIPFTTVAANSVPCGAQPVTSSLAVCRDGETVDQGVLYEKRWGLAYQSRDERDNAPVLMQLDFNRRHFADAPQPTDDDQRTRNTWTASRPSGSSVTYEQTDGNLGSATIGDWIDSASTNVDTDTALLYQASYRALLGTVDDERWPSINVALHSTPDLIPTYPDLPYGSRIQLLNQPNQLAPGAIDVVLEGRTDQIVPKFWTSTLNTSPFAPYHVFRLSEDAGDINEFVGYLVPDSCVLAADIDTVTTSVTITTVPLWSTDVDNWTPGALLRVGGETMLVTGVAGGSNPQTLTVTRSVNTVVAAHSAGATLDFVYPGYLALS